MKFKTMSDVTTTWPQGLRRPDADQLGPTRYVPWTSWASAVDDLAPTLRQHVDRGRELGHGHIRPRAHHNLGIADNYQQPVGTTQQRSATGPWT